MTAKQLKNSILQQAIQGKLIKQNKEDKPASELLKRIKAEREKLIKSGKIKVNKNISAIYRKGNSFYEKIENEEICIDEELPFEIPKTWEWVRLYNISKNITAGGDKPNKFSKCSTKECSIPVLSNGEKDFGLFGYTDIPRITEHSITVSGRGTIGFSCVRRYPYTPIVRLICIIPMNIINLDYLQIVLTTLLEKGVGTSIKQLTVPMLSPKLIPLPTIEEQKRIVNKLNQLMPLIEEYKEKENKLNELDKKFPERLKKSILKEAFDGKLIKSYNKKTLEEICIYSTSNIAIKDIKNKKGNYPVYGASGIIGYVDFYSKEKECVAVVKDGSIGKVFLLPAKSSVISTLCYLENIEILNIKYLYYFLQSINFIKYKKGSMIPHIYFKDYKKEKVIIPPIEEQKRIVEKLDKLINACEELKKILFI
ncbi:hypothetical protein EPJ74_03855 [Brachyspira aalborgi]|uniref:Type I restriction modification DNA specificity domain-containing protein n=1 Tax=Brachyspira aalborgi TaxID=29522 RepID=A0A5C8GHB9_9SPIR|nr:restriction endonuclease subunit S [Brachyspira aalborgi]TXJ61371.1 hypothetical protein EPJ74_03855 [Brachyspira aalborgi]